MNFTDDFFGIKNRYADKRLMIYGLNEDTKKAIMLLAHLGLSIAGILAGRDKTELSGCSYLGIPIYNDITELGDKKTFVLLDVYGRHLVEIESIYAIKADVIFAKDGEHEKILIYGAGNSGRKVADFFDSCGIKIECFIDKKGADYNNDFDGIKVKAPNALETYKRDYVVIVAIQDEKEALSLTNLIKDKGFSKVFWYDNTLFENTFCSTLWEKRDNEYLPVFWPLCLKYLFDFIKNNEKKIYLYSENKMYLKNVCDTLDALGIRIHGRLSQYVTLEDKRDMGLSDVWDVLYEDSDSYLIWSLLGDVESGRRFMHQSGLSNEIFLYGSTGPLMLEREYILDTNLGYSDKRGTVNVKNSNKINKEYLSLAIVGGSASDYDLYYEKSWTKCLINEANKKKISLDCNIAATAGNTSGQELIRLIRDIIKLKPDVVISYSGINEIEHTVKNHPYTHNYQKKIFDCLMGESSKIDFFDAGYVREYSMGESNDSINAWIQNERIMKAICDEFNIVFLCFLQPYLFSKKNLSKFDEELIEHLTSLEKDRIKNDNIFYEKCKKESSKYPWIIDFTNAFDDINDNVFFDYVHVTGKYNATLADRILDIVISTVGEVKK